MDQEIVIEFEIENPKLISINEQYIHPVRKTKSGRYYSYFAKSDYLKEVQEFYREVLTDKIRDEDVKRLKEFVDSNKSHGVSLTIELGLPLRDIRDNDASNFIKAIEDCIVTRTTLKRGYSIDDSCNYEVTVRKCRYESEDKSIIVKIVLKSYLLQGYARIEDPDQLRIPMD